MKPLRIETLVPTLLLAVVLGVGMWVGRRVRPPVAGSRETSWAGMSPGDPAMSSIPAARRGNRLIHETSPYLLQHAHNPVDWYPWGDEAFARARREDKPVFLSIGYASCHWCHVMEHESFENEAVAALLNEHFICIKVDREERPDVDHLYMTAVQMMTGSGGWPLSVFLAPDRRPFYGGTYFPPEDVYGRPGFRRVLHALAEAWRGDRQRLLSSATQLEQALTPDPNLSTAPAGPPLLAATYAAAGSLFDAQEGGFGGAPKFPQPAILGFLLRRHLRTGDPQALTMVVRTLDAMAAGGIHDHLGGGFHRYATDAAWRVPHFEKMLYDQAQLAEVYLDAFKVTGQDRFAGVTRDILDYVTRDLRDGQGGFHSAEDADSEGREGAFYVWTEAEVRDVLGAETAASFLRVYGGTARGNFEHGTNILFLRGADPAPWAEARRRLLDVRKRRVRPFRDDKIVTGWNGLMIAALAEAGRALDEPRYLEAATAAAEFLWDALRVGGRLQRSWRAGRCSGPAYLDDYAFTIQGLHALYEATLSARWLRAADDLAGAMLELFGDPRGGALFLTGHDAEVLSVRAKPQYDGAVPSGNAVAALALFRLGRCTGNSDYRRRAQAIVEQAAPGWTHSPLAHVALASALDYDLGPTREVTVAGDRSDVAARAILARLGRMFRPNTVLLHRPVAGTPAELAGRVAFLADQGTLDGRPTVYVCRDGACAAPVQSLAALDELLVPLRRTDP